MVEKCGSLEKVPSHVSLPGPGPKLNTGSKDIKQKANYNLDSHIDSFMRSLMASKGFYRSLADTMCSADKFATGLDQDHCWNGENLERFVLVLSV